MVNYTESGQAITTYPNKHYPDLKKLVKEAALKAKMSESEWMRQALTEKLNKSPENKS